MCECEKTCRPLQSPALRVCHALKTRRSRNVWWNLHLKQFARIDSGKSLAENRPNPLLVSSVLETYRKNDDDSNVEARQIC